MQEFQDHWVVQWESANTKIIVGVYSAIDIALMVASQTAINQVRYELDTLIPKANMFIEEMLEAHKTCDYTTVINLWNVELKPFADDPDLVVNHIKSLSPMKSGVNASTAVAEIQAKLKGQ